MLNLPLNQDIVNSTIAAHYSDGLQDPVNRRDLISKKEDVQVNALR